MTQTHNHLPTQPVSRLSWLCLLGLVLLTCLLRLHAVGEPVERDLATYAYIGHQLRAGELLYTQLLDIKAPAIYISYMVAETLFGYSALTIVILGIILHCISLVLVFFIVRKLSSVKPALLAGLFFALTSAAYQMQANLPNTESFVNAFLLAGLLSLLHARPARRNLVWLAGFFFAIAAAFKIHALVFTGGITLFLLLDTGKNQEHRPIPPLKLLAGLWVPSLVVLLSPPAYFWIRGRFSDFWAVFYSLGKAYMGSPLRNEVTLLTHLRLLFPKAILPLAPLYILSLAGFHSLRTFRRIHPVFFLSIGFSALLMVGVTPNFFPHYYQLWIPSLCIIAPLSLARLAALYPRTIRDRNATFLLLTVLSLAWMLPSVIGYMQMSPASIAYAKYGHDDPQRIKVLGQKIAGLTGADDSVFQWGIDPGIYFYSHRKAASRFLSLHLLHYAPPALRRQWQGELLAEVRTNLPVLIVINRNFGTAGRIILHDVLKKNYVRHSEYGPYALYLKKTVPPE